MPARQGGAVANDVLGCPEDAPIVDVASYVIIGADDLEVARRHCRHHEIDNLLWRPRSRRLLSATAGGHAGKG